MNQNEHDFRIEQEVFINAPREEVFKALTEKVEDWWRFRLAPEGNNFSFHI